MTPELANYLNSIVESAAAHFTTEIVADESVFRARRHSVLPSESHVPYMHEHKPDPHPKGRMGAPPSHMATAGRLNAAGIPYLYAASDKLTAVAEVRPWVGAYLSVAQLRLTKPVKLIDMRLRESSDSKPAQIEAEFEQFWSLWQETICWSFSLPHHPEDNTAYTPTQYFAAAFHNAGLDGIIYSSSLNWGGFNYAFFDPKIAVVESVELERVDSVRYELATEQ
ncbi:RES family NAD+ phosphorylase [Roseiconus lacunae]|uniref:RES family NAD+ phosphorylase n=1 Tax=Roseiconus lacunae TaxID=2605694 RepID=UPI0013DB87F8